MFGDQIANDLVYNVYKRLHGMDYPFLKKDNNSTDIICLKMNLKYTMEYNYDITIN